MDTLRLYAEVLGVLALAFAIIGTGLAVILLPLLALTGRL
jgi:hypothetical protein